MYKITMGIDQSFSCTGIVVFDGNDYMIHHQTIKTKKEEGSIFKRSLIITNNIIDLIKLYGVDRINIEGLAFGNMPGNATRDLACLQGVIITKILDVLGKECNIIPPKTVKKIATGNGNASKSDMIASLPEKILEEFKLKGYRKTTGMADVTDAFFIGKF